MRKQLHILAFCCLVTISLQAQLIGEPVASISESEKMDLLEVEKSNVSTVDFELVGGLIMVKAQTDGLAQTYILDTGAPTLVLNKKTNDMRGHRNYATGLAGYSAIIDVDVDYFRMGNIVESDVEAFATDISHLEEIKKTTIDGLIGYELLKEASLLLDYANQQIKFLPSGQKHEIPGKEEILAIPFKMRGHLPVIEMHIGKKKLRMGIDTGSEANLLDDRFKRKFRKLYTDDFKTKYLRGIDKSMIIAHSINLNAGRIQEQDLEEMEFLFTDMAFLNSGFGKRMDGLLGYPFLRSYLVGIDFGQQMIYVMKDELEEELEQMLNTNAIVDQESISKE